MVFDGVFSRCRWHLHSIWGGFHSDANNSAHGRHAFSYICVPCHSCCSCGCGSGVVCRCAGLVAWHVMCVACQTESQQASGAPCVSQVQGEPVQKTLATVSTMSRSCKHHQPITTSGAACSCFLTCVGVGYWCWFLVLVLVCVGTQTSDLQDTLLSFHCRLWDIGGAA